MCGIAGILAPRLNSQSLLDAVDMMSLAVRHRGRDGEGREFVESHGLVMAHRRLSIIDLSELGRQPMRSASARWLLSFNGEIYNYIELRSSLEAHGHRFRSTSDTEVLVELIDQVGIERALLATNGMFAIAAWDAQEHSLYLARDRFGEKPLYWTPQPHLIAYSSEISGLNDVPGVELSIDRGSASSLLRWSFIPHPHTIYQNVFQVPPGSFVIVKSHDGALRHQVHEWWSISDEIGSARSHQSSVEAADGNLIDTLRDSIRIRTRSDVPIGAFLSGGIDSSLVALLAQEALGGRRLRTLTVSMPDLGFNEASEAAAVARFIGSEHTEIVLSSSESIRLVTEMPEIWSEPFGDPSMLPTALLCRAALPYAKVCLSGDGGDEVFAGYNRHSFGIQLDASKRLLPHHLRRWLARIASSRHRTAVTRILELAPAKARVPGLETKLDKFAELMRSDETTWESLAGVWPTAQLRHQFHSPKRADPGLELSPLEQLVWIDLCSVLPDQMLVKVDRASMAAGLEVRAPMLDPRLLRLSWQGPLSQNVSRTGGKQMLGHVAFELIPKNLLDRPKIGFDPPIGTWLRSSLRDWAIDQTANSRCVSMGLLDDRSLQSAISVHLSAERDLSTMLWPVLMLESWIRARE